MITNILPLLGLGQAAQSGGETPTEDFAALLKGQMKPLLSSVPQEIPEQPVPMPGENLVNILHVQAEDMVVPPGETPEKPPHEKGEKLADWQIFPQSLLVEPRHADLQNLVVQMDKSVATAAAQATLSAVTDADGLETTPSGIAQVVFTTRQGIDTSVGVPPTAAALAKYNSVVMNLEAKAKGDAQPVIVPMPTELEEPEQYANMFKPLVEAAVNADLPASFVPVGLAHTATSTLLASHTTSEPVIALPSLVLNQELGSPAWQHALSQQVAMFTRNGIHNAEIRLNPAELGVIKINLRMNSERANLHFVSENHQVRAVLEAAMPQLRSSLAESGINLNASSVGSDSTQSWSGSSYSDGPHGQAAHSDKIHEHRHIEEDDMDIHTPVIHLKSGINTFV